MWRTPLSLLLALAVTLHASLLAGAAALAFPGESLAHAALHWTGEGHHHGQHNHPEDGAAGSGGETGTEPHLHPHFGLAVFAPASSATLPFGNIPAATPRLAEGPASAGREPETLIRPPRTFV